MRDPTSHRPPPASDALCSVCAVTATLLLALVAIGAAAIGWVDPARLKAAVDGMSSDGNAKHLPLAELPGIQQRLLVLAAVALILAVAASLPALRVGRLLAETVLVVARWPRSLLAGLRSFAAREPRSAAIVAGCTLLALALAVLRLQQTVHYDEAFSFVHYVRKPAPVILCYYTTANNHILNTLAMRACYLVFGAEPWALRLPALVFGVLTVPAAYAATRALFDRRAATVATAAIATWPYLVDVAANARGYTMLNVCVLVLLALVPRLVAAPTRSRWLAFVVASAAGFFAVPVMMYPFVTIIVYLLLLHHQQPARSGWYRQFALAMAATSGLVLMLYLPALIASNPTTTERLYPALEWVPAEPGWTARWRTLLEPLWHWWTFGYHPLATAVAVACCAAGCLRAPRLVAATLAGIIGVGMVMPLPPPWSVPYLCVLLLMISAVGVVRIADWGSAVLGRRATLVAPAIALAVTTTNVWLDCRYHDRVAAPWFIGNVDARATATWLAANRPAIDPAIAAGDESILYYLYLAGTSDLDVFFDRDRAESTGTVWLIERDVPPIARERSARIRAEIEQQNFRVTDTVHTMRRSRILAMRKQR